MKACIFGAMFADTVMSMPAAVDTVTRPPGLPLASDRNLLRPVTDLHQVSYEGLHLRCHVRRYRDVDACSSRHCHEATRIAISIRSESASACNRPPSGQL